ncbi:ABC transporter substrate-binding protein [Thermodesulfobacteriota bacterium]
MDKKDFSIRFLFILALISSALILVSNHPSKAETTPKPQYGGILKIIETAGPSTPFGWPPECVGGSSTAYRPSIEPLVREDNMGSILPWLATSWKNAPDKKSITFNLRKGVKFHDGTDFNAKAAKWNLDALKAKRKPGTSIWTSIEVIDDYTVRINLSRYENTILNNMALSASNMVSPTAFKTKGIEWVRWHPVGTGPFKFVSFKRDVVTKYKRNNDYWQKGKPYLDGIELHYIKDPMTQRASMQAGDAEVMTSHVGKVAADLKAKGFNILHAPVATLTLMPDSANPNSPFADKRVRVALGHAIDRKAIVKAKGYGFWEVAYQVTPSTTIAYNPDLEGRARRYDPNKARQMLADAGHTNGFKIKIIPDPRSADRDVLVAVQSYLGAIGIKVDLDFVPRSRFTEYRMKGWHDAILQYPIGVGPNPISAFQYLFSAGSTRFPSLKRPDGFFELLNEALTADDFESQKAANQKVITKIFEEAMVIPYYTFDRCVILRKGVNDTGFLTSGQLSMWRPDNAWLSK